MVKIIKQAVEKLKYNQVAFRTYYHNYIAVPMKANLKIVLKDFLGADKENCILTYGYIDHTAGLTLEILAAGYRSDDVWGQKTEGEKIVVCSNMNPSTKITDAIDSGKQPIR